MDIVDDIESTIELIPGRRYDISSSAASSSTPTWTYDVFLSFRGEDTRRTFVGHLFYALCGKGIYTYKDDQRLEKGKTFHRNSCKPSKNPCLPSLSSPRTMPPQLGAWMNFYELIQKLVENLHSQLHPFEIPDARHDLVGVGSHVEEVISMMDLRRDEVRVVGIHGKPGIGKTTIARVSFDKLSYKFEAACFLDDVGQISKKHGVDYLQEILLSEILKLRNVKIRSTSEGMNIIMRRLRHLRVLIVLDDVDHANQLEALAGNRKWFGAGSRVIITTKDGELLPKCGADGVYKVNGLSYDEAKQLFSLHAFGSRTPGVFRKHLVGPICYIFRLPASVKAWASLLSGRDIAWKNIFKTLKPIGNLLFLCVVVACLTGFITVFVIVVMGFAGVIHFPRFITHPHRLK